MTDTRTRPASEVRTLLTRHGGNLGASGSVGYMFKKQGLVVYDKTTVDENKVTDAAIELGAEDVQSQGESLVVVTDPKEFERVRDGLKKIGLPTPHHAEVTLVPQTIVHLAGKEAEQALKLIDLLEDHDDIQHVYSNLDVDESTLASSS